MEISDSSSLSSFQAVQLQTQNARVLRVNTQPTNSELKSSPSERVIEADLGLPSTGADIPLTSTGDIRSYTSANLEAGDSGNSLEERVTEEAVSQSSNSAENLNGGLTEEEQELVNQLKARDAEVRQHEQAHVAAAGSYVTGAIQYEYQTGPDGKQYAIGGHVNIDTSQEPTPEATIAKAQQLQRAAMAPADPSPQDIKVAAQASRMLQEAQSELQQEQLESIVAKDEDSNGDEPSSAVPEVANPSDSEDEEGASSFAQTYNLEEQSLGVLREA